MAVCAEKVVSQPKDITDYKSFSKKVLLVKKDNEFLPNSS